MNLPKYFWQTTTALLLAVCVGLWFNKPPSFHDYRTSNIQYLNPGHIVLHAGEILDETKASVMVLWITDINVNARTVLYMHDTNGVVNRLIGYTDQIYSQDSAINVFMTQLMTGQLSCGQVNTTSKVGQYVADVGAPSICRRGLLRGGDLVGYISLSYPKSPTTEEVIRLNGYLDALILQTVI